MPSLRRLIIALLLLSTPTVCFAQLTVVWENRGQAELEGAVLDVAAAGNVAVAVGNVCTAPATSACNWFVRAIDTLDGTTLWEDRLNVGFFDRSQGVAITGNRVFASGWFQTATTGFDFVVRAYDLRSGTLLWQQRIHRGGFVEFAELIGAQGNRVYAVGRVLGASRTSDFTVMAFDARTGAPLWESVLNTFGTDVAFSVSEQGERVFAVGLAANFFDLLLRAYDGLTGSVLWEHRVPNGSQFVSNRSLAAHGGLLYVSAGIFSNAGEEDAIVHAYDQRTGALRWSQRIDAGRNDEAVTLTVHGNTVFAALFEDCDNQFLACSFATRAFDASSGVELWHDRFQDVAGADTFPQSLVVANNRLFVGGASADADGVYHWRLRLLDLATGDVLADERDTSALGGAINKMADANGVVLAGGYRDGVMFTVRAYR
jgi:outer membrane protein assembly factor BamB